MMTAASEESSVHRSFVRPSLFLSHHACETAVRFIIVYMNLSLLAAGSFTHTHTNIYIHTHTQRRSTATRTYVHDHHHQHTTSDVFT